MVRRVLVAMLVGVWFVVAPASAFAAGGSQPILTLDGPLTADAGSGVSFSFGATRIDGEVASATLTIPAYHGITVTTDGPNCVPDNRQLICSSSDVRDGENFGNAEIHVPAGTPLGDAGSLSVTTPDGGSKSMDLWIISHKLGADLGVVSSNPTGRIGDTVTVNVYVTNYGPSPEPRWDIGDVVTPGAHLVGMHGCTSVHGGECDYYTATAVGKTVHVQLLIKITGPDSASLNTGFTFGWSLNDPNLTNIGSSFTIHRGSVTSLSSTSDHGESATAAPTRTSASPTATATASSNAVSAEPTPATAQSAAGPAATLAAHTSETIRPANSSAGPWIAAIGVLLVGAAAVVVARRRRSGSAG